MLSILATAVLGGWGRIPSQELNRLRTILPNGAVVVVEKVPDDSRLTLQFFVSSRTQPDGRQTDGYRHLWEHLVAKGRTRSLDKELESNGAFLTAQTYRDATVFQIVLRPKDLKLGLSSVRALTELGDFGVEDIAKEGEIIRQEVGLQTAERKLDRQAWMAAYGDDGLDPLGDPDVISAASPIAVQRLHHALMSGQGLTLLISGNVDLDLATEGAKEVLALIPAGSDELWPTRKFLGGALSSCDTVGAALAVNVKSWDSPSTAAKLAAALAIGSTLKSSFVAYTPSLEGSLVVVGETAESGSFSKSLAKMNPSALFGLGRILAHRWASQEGSIAKGGILTGLLISEGPGQRLKTLEDNLDRMTVSEFNSAFQGFIGPDAVEVLGK